MTPTYFSFFLTTLLCISLLFFFNDTATTEIYTLSLHDALPISRHERRDGAIGHLCARGRDAVRAPARRAAAAAARVGCDGGGRLGSVLRLGERARDAGARGHGAHAADQPGVPAHLSDDLSVAVGRAAHRVALEYEPARLGAGGRGVGNADVAAAPRGGRVCGRGAPGGHQNPRAPAPILPRPPPFRPPHPP